MAIESLPTFTKPARQRWESIPADIRQRLLSNVWCGQCRHETTITNFSRAIMPRYSFPHGAKSTLRHGDARGRQAKLAKHVGLSQKAVRKWNG